MKVRYDCAMGGQFFMRFVCWLRGYRIMFLYDVTVPRQTCGTCGATREKGWGE